MLVTNGKRKEYLAELVKTPGEKYVDLTGQRFGRLVAKEYMGKKKYKGNSDHPYWLCQCDCGNETIVNGNNLRRGAIKSCGCMSAELARERMKEVTKLAPRTKHGMADSNIYSSWNKMKGRCYNTSDPAFETVGAKGIIVCDEWKDSFENFYHWSMGNGYQPGLVIDRLNKGDNYSPENCRWVTRADRSNNSVNNIILTYAGYSLTCKEWMDVTGLSSSTMSDRIKLKWPVSKILHNREDAATMILHIPNDKAHISEERRRVYHITIDEGINKLSDFIRYR